MATVSQRLVSGIRSNYFLLLIGQKAKNSGCDWFIQLSNNRCPVTAFCYWTLSNKLFYQMKENRVLNEPIRFELTVILILILRILSV